MLKLIVFGFSSVKIIIPIMYFGEEKKRGHIHSESGDEN